MCTRQTGSSRSNEYGSIARVVRRLVALLEVFDLDHAALVDGFGERPDELFLGVADEGGRRLRQLELSKGLLELATYAVERRMGLGGDRRADVFDREPDGSRLERGQLRRPAEHVTVELLVDPHRSGVVVDFGVHRVAAAAEVDEVEQGEGLLQLLPRNREAGRKLIGIEHRLSALTARGEDLRQQCLQHAKALGRDGPDGTVGLVRRMVDPPLARRSGTVTRVGLSQPAQPLCDGRPELLRRQWDGAAVLSQHPAGERLDACVRRLEDAVLEHARVAEGAVNPPGRVTLDLDPGMADGLADLPGRGTRCASTSNSAGSRKSRSRRVAKRMSLRMRETRKVRTASRSRSWPITYQTPSSSRSAYGLSVRSETLSRRGDQ